jgi:hypothetical protein
MLVSTVAAQANWEGLTCQLDAEHCVEPKLSKMSSMGEAAIRALRSTSDCSAPLRLAQLKELRRFGLPDLRSDAVRSFGCRGLFGESQA